MPDADPWPAVACLGVLSSRHGCNGDAALRAAGRPRLLPAGEPTLPWNLLFSLRRPSPKPRSCAARMGLAAASSRRRRGGRSKGGRPASARSNSGRPASVRSKGGRRRGLDLGHESSSGSIRLGRDPIPEPALPPHRRLRSRLPSSPSYPAPSPPRRSGLLRRHGDLPHVLQPRCPHQAPRRLPRSPVTTRAPVPTGNGLDRCVHILARGSSAPRGSGTGACCHGRRRG